MRKSGIKHFRTSLSWSQLIPTGVLGDGHSESGVNFYKDVFKTMLDNGITPLVTSYHWDLRLADLQNHDCRFCEAC